VDGWLAGCLTSWLAGCLPAWLAGCLAGSWLAWLASLIVGLFVFVRSSICPAARPCVCGWRPFVCVSVADWLVGWLAGGWLVGWLAGWAPGCLAG